MCGTQQCLVIALMTLKMRLYHSIVPGLVVFTTYKTNDVLLQVLAAFHFGGTI